MAMEVGTAKTVMNTPFPEDDIFPGVGINDVFILKEEELIPLQAIVRNRLRGNQAKMESLLEKMERRRNQRK
ncbi:MAG: hypothetical protein V3V92_02240 [Candidatus Hydrothermarchaeales archaeon]